MLCSVCLSHWQCAWWYYHVHNSSVMPQSLGYGQSYEGAWLFIICHLITGLKRHLDSYCGERRGDSLLHIPCSNFPSQQLNVKSGQRNKKWASKTSAGEIAWVSFFCRIFGSVYLSSLKYMHANEHRCVFSYFTLLLLFVFNVAIEYKC